MNNYRKAGAFTLQDLVDKRFGSKLILTTIDTGDSLELSFRLRNTQGYIELTEVDNGLYNVSSSEADSGWGPLVYDWAIEEITQRGGHLCADRWHSVSSAARRVWDYYLNNRNDVSHRQINNLEDLQTFQRFPYPNIQRILEVYPQYEIPKKIWDNYPIVFKHCIEKGTFLEVAPEELNRLKAESPETYRKLSMFFEVAGVNYMFQKRPNIINQITFFEENKKLEREYR